MVKRIAREQIVASGGQNAEMKRAVAISRETAGSTNLYSSIVTTAPGGRTEVHHHGECETSIYILKGRARFYSGEGLSDTLIAEEGDFVYVPAYEVHVEENASDDAPLVVLLSRNCSGPVVHYVGDGDVGASTPS